MWLLLGYQLGIIVSKLYLVRGYLVLVGRGSFPNFPISQWSKPMWLNSLNFMGTFYMYLVEMHFNDIISNSNMPHWPMCTSGSGHRLDDVSLLDIVYEQHQTGRAWSWLLRLKTFLLYIVSRELSAKASLPSTYLASFPGHATHVLYLQK